MNIWALMGAIGCGLGAIICFVRVFCGEDKNLLIAGGYAVIGFCFAMALLLT